jgi:hypothetical protein
VVSVFSKNLRATGNVSFGHASNTFDIQSLSSDFWITNTESTDPSLINVGTGATGIYQNTAGCYVSTKATLFCI